MARNAFYDNLKFILIALVLIGHFTGGLLDTCFPMKVFWRWIYLFHMPAFLFVGGLFSKKLYTPDKGLRINVIAFYLLTAFIMYALLWAEKRLWGSHPEFDFFTLGSVPWYLVAMAAFGASTPIISKVRGGWRSVIPAAVALAVIAPFNDGFNDFLVSGRIVAYAPFYFAGYFIDIKKYSDWISSLKRKKYPIVLAIVVMIAVYAALYLLPKNITGAMSGLGTGHNTYSDMGFMPAKVDALLRLIDILIAGIMIVAISLLTPSKRCLITPLGARTLQVYFLHPFIYYPLSPLGFYDLLIPYQPYASISVTILAIGLTFLLAIPKWPEAVFAKLRKSIRIDATEALEHVSNQENGRPDVAS